MKPLSPADEAVVKKCLHFTANTDVFPEQEFHTLLGAERVELKRLALAFPKYSSDTEALVQNVLNNLAGYPHSRGQDMELAVGATSEELRKLLERMRGGT